MRPPIRILNDDIETAARLLEGGGTDVRSGLAGQIRAQKIHRAKHVGFSHGYEFPGGLYRAQRTKVVDGDTFDVVMDLGMDRTEQIRLRPWGVNCEEMNDRDPKKRMRAADAKLWVGEAVPGAGHAIVPSPYWPLLIETRKKDSFGRWLAHIWFIANGSPSDRAGLENGKEYHLNQELLDRDHAVPYVKGGRKRKRDSDTGTGD